MVILPQPGICVVKPDKIEERTTKAGIIVAKTEAKRGRFEETQMGKIIAIRYSFEQMKEISDEIMLKVGDTIVYGEWSGWEMDLEDTRYRFLEIKDVRAKLIREKND